MRTSIVSKNVFGDFFSKRSCSRLQFNHVARKQNKTRSRNYLKLARTDGGESLIPGVGDPESAGAGAGGAGAGGAGGGAAALGATSDKVY